MDKQHCEVCGSILHSTGCHLNNKQYKKQLIKEAKKKNG